MGDSRPEEWNMKKLAIIGLVLGSSAAFAAGPVISDNANGNACFGQARAYYITQVLGGAAWGNIASDRAGDNAAMNAAYRGNCQP
jgi:hypothetical protein